MTNDLRGIHHVTALCGPPLPNLRFYRDAIGLRLVKKTINFDNPHGYHFYFGDRGGRPGTLITFFPHPGFKPGVPGAREVARTDLGVPAGSLGYWADRLRAAGVTTAVEPSFDGADRLAFVDPDGTRLSLVEADLRELGAEPPTSDVPPGRAIGGLASVATVVTDLDATASFLTGTLGFAALSSAGGRAWFQPGGGVPIQLLEVIEDPAAPPAVLGRGSVHHVAWRVADDAAQARVRAAVDGKVLGLTPVRDRSYFRSIYFREPGGVIFEVATDGPGFAVDEDPSSLGTALKLPSQFEPRRVEIEAVLPRLDEKA